MVNVCYFIQVPRDLKARNFAGCLYEVILDGKKVGLWNFVTSQGCDACKEGYENVNYLFENA